MQIRVFSILFLIVALADCALLNRTGTTDRYKGSAVKDKIQDASTVSAQLYAISSGDFSGATYAQNVIFPAILAGIEPGEYYAKADVDSCVSEIKLFGALGVQPVVATVFGQCSTLKPDGTVYGDY